MAAAIDRLPNDAILAQLSGGMASFEIAQERSLPLSCVPLSLAGVASLSLSPALKKLERYRVEKVAGDGRCMFRALVKGMAKNKGLLLSPKEEVEDADDLRMAVKEVICDSEAERRQYEEAVIAITVDEPLNRYCQRIKRYDFWGGESELLVLSKLCRQPIIVYIPEHEHSATGRRDGFIPIAEYGAEYSKNSKHWKKRVPVRLLYSRKNHYDLLL